MLDRSRLSPMCAPHMGIRHFTFVFKESPSETPHHLSLSPYPTLPESTNNSCSQLSVELGLVSVFELTSVSVSVSEVFLLQRFDSIRCRRRQR